MSIYARQLDSQGLTIIARRMAAFLPGLQAMIAPILHQPKPPGKFEFISLDPDVSTTIMDDLDVQGLIRRFCGSHARLDNHFCFSYPGEGVSPNIHGGPFSEVRSVYYQRHGDVVQTSNLKVGIVLQDQDGLAYIRGSHVMLARQSRNVDLTRPPLKAGDVVVFTDALVHGTAHSDTPRQILYYTFTPGHVVWATWEQPVWRDLIPEHRRKFIREPGVMQLNQQDRTKLISRIPTFK